MNNKFNRFDIILLCGGKGQRLRPYTLNIPKPLLIVNKKPFLYFIIKKFLRLNFSQIILATGYKSNKVSKFVNSYFKNNKKIKLIDSGNVDIIKRIQDCSKYIQNDFFVCYGDTYIHLDLKKYIRTFIKSKKPAFVTGTYFKFKYGTIIFNKKNYLIKKFTEKPTFPYPINLGYFIFKKSILEIVNKSSSWIKFIDKLINKKKLFLNITNKKYFSFDSPRDYNEIKSRFIN
jgi:glucose-1-phosphate cytidylyltransferase